MKDGRWRERLAAAASADPRSDRAISIAAGLAPSYLHGILKEGKEPGVTRLAALAEVLNVSLSYIMNGYEIRADEEELLTYYARLSDDERSALLRFAGLTAKRGAPQQ